MMFVVLSVTQGQVLIMHRLQRVQTGLWFLTRLAVQGGAMFSMRFMFAPLRGNASFFVFVATTCVLTFMLIRYRL